MNLRFFAFGCSYTRYDFPTWADYIGVNFNEYYNYGRPGASNTYIMNRLVEANDIYKFDAKTDFIMVMLTGFNRFSYMNATIHPDKDWVTNGDLPTYTTVNTHDKATFSFYKNMWTENFAIYQSWIAVKQIKEILSNRNVKHNIIMGIDNSHYLNEYNHIHQDAKNKVGEIYNFLDCNVSMDEWKIKNKSDVLIWKNRAEPDSHPTHKTQYDFTHTFFPNLLSEKSKNLLEHWSENIIYDSQEKQGELFNNTFRDTSVISDNNRMF